MDDVFAIYCSSIVLSEQKTKATLQEMLLNENYYFFALSEDKKIIGISVIYAPTYLDYCLLEYLAIDANKRNGGYGGKFLSMLIKEFKNNNIIIEIDSPYEESQEQVLRQKRMGFYARHGFVYIEGLRYILPLKGHGQTPPEMILMLCSNIYKASVPKAKINSWLNDIYVSVYGCKPNDSRIEEMLGGLCRDVVLR